jgi:hypothetical protein
MAGTRKHRKFRTCHRIYRGFPSLRP